MADTTTALPLKDRADGAALRKEGDKAEGNSRVTVRLSGELGAAIQDLQEITSSSTPSEVVRRAIVVYHTLVKQKLKGNEPLIEVRDAQEVKKVPIFL